MPNRGPLGTGPQHRDSIAAVLAYEYAHRGIKHIGKIKSTEGVLGVLGGIAVLLSTTRWAPCACRSTTMTMMRKAKAKPWRLVAPAKPH